MLCIDEGSFNNQRYLVEVDKNALKMPYGGCTGTVTPELANQFVQR
jgi:hypothetical protein